MAHVRSVMDAQTTDFVQLQASIIDTAKAYGQLVPKLADATIEWAKQGRTQSRSLSQTPALRRTGPGRSEGALCVSTAQPSSRTASPS